MATKLDSSQAIQKSFDESSSSLKTLSVGGTLISEPFDNYDITYVPSGNGAGEVQTVTYKLGATVVGVITYVYNVDNKISSVTRS